MTLRELLRAAQEKLEGFINDQKSIVNKVESEGRNFTDDEFAKFTGLSDEIKAVEKEIEKLNAGIEAQKRTVGTKAPKVSEAKKLSQKFSILRAIRILKGNETLNGAEAEMDAEARIQAKERGLAISGIGIPCFYDTPEQRDLTAGSAVSAGNLIATDLLAFRDPLAASSKIAQLGVEVMSGLIGDVDIPVGDGLSQASWAGENTTAAETTPTTKMVSLRGKRLAAFTDVSNKLIRQTSGMANRYASNMLIGAEQRAIASALYFGTGASNQPTGVGNHVDVSTVALGTDGGAITREKLVEMISKIFVENAENDQMGFAVTPELREKLMNLKTDAGSGRFVWPENVLDMLLGYKAITTNLLPKNLTKGSGTNLHGLIFGAWNNAIVADWGIRDLTVNPYTKSKEDITEVVLGGYKDIGVTHGKGFSVIKDFDPTA